MKILESEYNALCKSRVIGDIEVWAQREGWNDLTKSIVVFVRKY